MGALTNVIAAAAHSFLSLAPKFLSLFWHQHGHEYVDPFARECSEFIDQPVPTVWARYDCKSIRAC